LLLGSFLYWRLKPSPRALEPWPDVIYSARKKLSLRKDPLIQAMSDIKLSHFYGKDDIIISAAIDLSNFQKQAGALVDTIALPTDTCVHLGNNAVAKILRREITVEDDVANLTLGGDIEVWRCVDLFGTRTKTRFLTSSFSVKLPFRLAGASRDTVLMSGNPAVTLSGPLGSAGDRIISSVIAEAKLNFARIITPNICRAALPEILTKLDPMLAQARFIMGDSGRLAVSCEMSVRGDDDAMARLLLSLQDREGKDEEKAN